MTNPHHCAFPADYKTQTDVGLTKREYFAGLVMQGFTAVGGAQYNEEYVVAWSVKLADALIAKLNETNETHETQSNQH